MFCPQQEKTSINKTISYYVRNPKIAERKIDETSFLIDPETDIILYLNPLSSGIWQLLKEPVSVLEATTIVQQAFPEIPPQKIAGDVSKLFNKMTKEKIVLYCD